MNVKLIHLRMTRLQDLGKRERDRARNVKEALLPVLEQVPDSNGEKSDKEYDNNEPAIHADGMPRDCVLQRI